MESINLDDNIISQEDAELLTSNEKIKTNIEQNKQFNLSNPIHTEIINFTHINDDIQYELKISYKDEKWMIKRNLSEITNLIKSLSNLNYVFFNENYFKTLDLTNTTNNKEINLNIINFLNYLNYRCDIMSNILSREFFEFKKCTSPEQLVESIKRENFEQIFNFIVEESDMTLSDYIYDSDLGLLIIGLQDVSYLSRIGRFWSLIDYEILGNLYIFQRVFDNQKRPYFRKIILKNFDVRVSKLLLNIPTSKIYIGMDNGSIQVFNINIIDKKLFQNSSTIQNESEQDKNEKIIAISEGNNFKYFNDRVTGIKTFSDFLFVTSKENKLMILDVSNSDNSPVIKFNASLKKRMEGKGHITNIEIDEGTKKLFVITFTNKIFIYDILTNIQFNTNKESTLEIKIEFFNEINTENNIKNIFMKNSSIFVALENRVNIFSFNKDKDQIFKSDFPLDGSLQDGLSLSSKYVKILYPNYITSICYFTDMKLFVIGLKNGTIINLNSRSLEVTFAKKISEHPIVKFILLEENYIVIAGDEKEIFFLSTWLNN